MAFGDYDTLHYPSFVHPRTHPAFIQVVGALLGQSFAPLKGARILEIGTSDGSNLLPMAVAWPDAEFIGIDPAKGRIQEGQRRIAEAGLSNITLLPIGAEALEVEDASLDYILIHGVMGWVSQEIQGQILALCARALSPRGVAYISYNVRPGWTEKMVISAYLRYFNTGEDPEAWCQDAAGLLERLETDRRSDEGFLGGAIEEAKSTLAGGQRSYFYHEFAGMAHEAWYFHEMESRARQAGLTWVGEAGVFDTLTPEDHTPKGGWPPALKGDAIRTQQYLDFTLNRHFRRSLFMGPRAERRPFQGLRSEKGGELLVGADIPQSPQGVDVFSASPATFRLRDGRRLKDARPLVKSAYLSLMDRWPALVDVETLLTEARGRLKWAVSPNIEGDRRLLLGELVRGFKGGLIHLSGDMPAIATTLGEAPKLSPAARALLASGNQEIIGAFHNGLELDAPSAEFAQLIDGQTPLEVLLASDITLPNTLPGGIGLSAGPRGKREFLEYLLGSGLLIP